MKVFIAGIDGYLGWPLAQYLASRGHDIAGADLFLRRQWVQEVNSDSVIPIASMEERLIAFRERWNQDLQFYEGDFLDYEFVERCLKDFQPEVIVHLGECPSAPYSQIDVHHATWVQKNNIIGNMNILFAIRDICPEIHLLKLGTMGEYGTPNLDIPEGFFEIEYKGRTDTLPFPRQAGSWYHLSKVHDSNNIMFACKTWGLRSTDVMQGVVFGTRIDEMGNDGRLLTRFDVDQCFGTAINRFCAQSVIGHPITLYGKGRQKRGFLPLRDSMQCLALAVEKPPQAGEYRVLNQFQEVYDIMQLAHCVQKTGYELGLQVEMNHLENPRIEKEEHYYRPDHQKLLDLGYQPTHGLEDELQVILSDLMKYQDRIEARRNILVPDIHWSGKRRKAEFIQ